MIIFFLIIYILIFIFLIFNFVRCLKNKSKWIKLFIYEIIIIILSLVLFIYYNYLPGNGFMPGLTYLGETLISFLAMMLYIIIFVVTLVVKLAKFLLDKKHNSK
ncbi:MAG: hypothetical protein ACI33S_04590 [Bacilli bacterium]